MLTLKNQKTHKSSLNNRSGQGVLEYILILVVTVGLIGLISNYFFKDMRSYIKNYMGVYVSCLLETGELPRVGVGGGGEDNQQAECHFNSSTGNVAGKEDDDTKGAGESPDDKEDSASTDEEGSGYEDSPNSESSVKSGRSRSRRATYAGSASRRNPFFRPRGGSRGGAEGRGSNKTIEITIDQSGESGGFYTTNNQFDRNRMRQQRYVAITGGMQEEMKKRSEMTKKGVKATVKTEASGAGAATKKIPIKPPETNQKLKVTDDEGMSFSLGNIFRILLIAAIIIIIVVLIGGQALQLSKSWEK